MNPEVYQPKFLHEQARDYRAELDDILSKELTAESIDTYAEDALQQLISLVQDAAQDYSRQPTIGFVSEKEQEDATFRYFELDELELVLDHVADKADEIRGLDRIIGQAEVIDQIITPPDPTEIQIKNGNGGFEEKRQIPRLKTVLFLLSNEFGVDLEDAEQLCVRKGVMNGSTVRKSSYFVVEAKTINRTVLVCDEEENVTYVLDTTKLKDKNIPNIESLTKQQWNELIAADPTLGKRLVYTGLFVENMVRLLREDAFSEARDAIDGVEGVKADYLKPIVPKAPEGVLSIGGLAIQLGISRPTISKLVAELNEDLGPREQYRFRSNFTEGLTPAQQETIIKRAEEKGYFSQKAPEGVLSTASLADKLGISDGAMSRLVAGLNDDLGPRERYKFGSKVAEGLSPEQQQIIIERAQQKGFFCEESPGSVLSASSLADKLGISNRAIYRLVAELNEDLGPRKHYKFASKVAEGLTPAQQEIIIKRAEENGVFCEVAPEDVLSTFGLAIQLGIDRGAMSRLVAELNEDLGPRKHYKFASKVAEGLSPEQQKIIIERAQEKGFFCEEAPEGVLSIGGLAKQLGVDHGTISRLVDKLDDGLGPRKQYRFGYKIAKGLTPAQQAILKEIIDKRKNGK